MYVIIEVDTECGDESVLGFLDTQKEAEEFCKKMNSLNKYVESEYKIIYEDVNNIKDRNLYNNIPLINVSVYRTNFKPKNQDDNDFTVKIKVKYYDAKYIDINKILEKVAIDKDRRANETIIFSMLPEVNETKEDFTKRCMGKAINLIKNIWNVDDPELHNYDDQRRKLIYPINPNPIVDTNLPLFRSNIIQ